MNDLEPIDWRQVAMVVGLATVAALAWLLLSQLIWWWSG